MLLFLHHVRKPKHLGGHLPRINKFKFIVNNLLHGMEKVDKIQCFIAIEGSHITKYLLDNNFNVDL